MCKPNETVDKEFNNTPNVIVLTLESVELLNEKSEGGGNIRHSKFKVDKTFKGNLKIGDEKLNYLSGRKIRLAGNGKNTELKTDENGVYEIYDLLPGKYKINLEKINGYSFTDDDSTSIEVEVKAKSHTEKDIFYSIRNAVRGKLYNADGKPLKDVKVALIPANEDFPLFYIGEEYTDENGTFEFSGISNGTFLIVVNKDDELSSDKKFGTFYYPGTANRAEASEITISPGTFYENFIIKVPRNNKGLKNEKRN